MLTKWVGQAWREMHMEHSSLICQIFRKLGLFLAVDGSEDDELSVKDIPGITVGDWKLSTGQEDIQEVEEPDTTDNSEEVQKDDETEGVIEVREYFLSDESGAVLNSDTEMDFDDD